MRSFSIKLLAAGVAVVLGTGLLVAQSPWADTKQIMNAMTIPASNELFNAGLEDENLTDDQWNQLRNQAIVLGESANLLLMAGRAPADSSKNADWKEAAQQMLDAAKLAVQKIDDKDLEGLMFDGSDAILTSCTACHSKYFQ